MTTKQDMEEIKTDGVTNPEHENECAESTPAAYRVWLQAHLGKSITEDVEASLAGTDLVLRQRIERLERRTAGYNIGRLALALTMGAVLVMLFWGPP